MTRRKKGFWGSIGLLLLALIGGALYHKTITDNLDKIKPLAGLKDKIGDDASTS